MSFPIEYLHQETPTILSNRLSQLSGRNVYLKLDNCQASGSFKLRGVGNMIYRNFKENRIQNIVTSSGGNAGLAAAYSGKVLKTKTTIVTPSNTPIRVVDELRGYGADVIIHGDVWDESDKKAHELVRTLPNSLYCPPFDHPLVWEGNSTIIDEVVKQMNDCRPDCVIASVGGGGLACGLIEGMVRHGWMTAGVTLLLVETLGADCFNKSVQADRVITLEGITSVAKTLGAKKCANRLFDLWKEYSNNIKSIVVTDKEAVEACCKFLDDHNVLVEPACGAALAVAYNLDKFVGKLKYPNVLVEVCGGRCINLEALLDFKKKFEIV